MSQTQKNQPKTQPPSGRQAEAAGTAFEKEKQVLAQLIDKLRKNEEGMAKMYLKPEAFQNDVLSDKALHRIGRFLLAEKHQKAFRDLEAKCKAQALVVCKEYLLQGAEQISSGQCGEQFKKDFTAFLNTHKSTLSYVANRFFDGDDIDEACQSLDAMKEEALLEACKGFWPDLCEYDPDLDAYYCKALDAMYDAREKYWVKIGATTENGIIMAPPPTWAAFKDYENRRKERKHA